MNSTNGYRSGTDVLAAFGQNQVIAGAASPLILGCQATRPLTVAEDGHERFVDAPLLFWGNPAD